jgi:hypothetical protein
MLAAFITYKTPLKAFYCLYVVIPPLPLSPDTVPLYVPEVVSIRFGFSSTVKNF